MLCAADATGLESSAVVSEGRFSAEVLAEAGVRTVQVPSHDARDNGEGPWIAIRRDPETGAARGASHSRHDSAAVAD